MKQENEEKRRAIYLDVLTEGGEGRRLRQLVEKSKGIQRIREFYRPISSEVNFFRFAFYEKDYNEYLRYSNFEEAIRLGTIEIPIISGLNEFIVEYLFEEDTVTVAVSDLVKEFQVKDSLKLAYQ